MLNSLANTIRRGALMTLLIGLLTASGSSAERPKPLLRWPPLLQLVELSSTTDLLLHVLLLQANTDLQQLQLPLLRVLHQPTTLRVLLQSSPPGVLGPLRSGSQGLLEARRKRSKGRSQGHS